MQKQVIFQSRLLPYLLVVPQLAIVLIFFYWPAAQAVLQSFLLQDAFGLSPTFVWFENYRELLQPARLFRGHRHDIRLFVCDRFLVAVLRAAAGGDGGQAAARRHDLSHAADLALCGGPAGRRRVVDIHAPSLARHSGARAARHGDRLESAAQRQPGRDRWSSSPPPGSRFPTTSCSSSPVCKHPEERDRGGRDRRRAADAAVLDRDLPAAVADHLLPAGRQYRLRLLRHVRHHRHHDPRRPGTATRRWSTRSMSTACSAAISAARRRNRSS